MTNKKMTIGILGGGISGLVTAYALQKGNLDVTVYERKDQAGGAIQTILQEDWLVENGPNTLQVKSQQVWDLLEELSLKSEIVKAPSQANKRYVVKGQTPLALPQSLKEFFTTPLLSAAGKLRLLREPFISRSKKEDETIAGFIRRRIGQQPLDYGVNPFVSGIFAGDPEQLSIRHTFSSLWEMEQEHGSLTKGMFGKIKSKGKSPAPPKALLSFRKGLHRLPAALSRSLGRNLKTGTTITNASEKKGKWQIRYSVNGEMVTKTHDILVSTLPTHTLDKIFAKELLKKLSDLPYAPLSVLAMGFRREQVKHPLDGFGMLIPEIERLNTLGMLFSSTLFPGRAPKDHCLITCFIGGARNPEAAAQQKQILIQKTLKDLDLLLNINGKPVFTHHQYWEKTIPQYTLGYGRYLTLMNKAEEQLNGLYLTGNFRDGVSVPDCIRNAVTTAEKIRKEAPARS